MLHFEHTRVDAFRHQQRLKLRFATSLLYEIINWLGGKRVVSLDSFTGTQYWLPIHPVLCAQMHAIPFNVAVSRFVHALTGSIANRATHRDLVNVLVVKDGHVYGFPVQIRLPLLDKLCILAPDTQRPDIFLPGRLAPRMRGKFPLW
jgi:hypothetical protein